MMSLAEVIDQMQGNGLPALPHGHPVMDGKIKRFGPGKKAWYALREVDLRSGARVISGAFGIWQGDNNNAVAVAADWQGVSPEERADAERKLRDAERAAAEKKERVARWAANRARAQWSGAEPFDPSSSGYLQRKQVSAEGVRIDADGTLLVPMKKYSSVDGVHLVGIQKIAADGAKRFSGGMDKIGAACLLGRIDGESKIAGICEGYATGRSARMAVDLPVMVAFDAGNLMAVAQGMRKDFPELHLLFLADDDWQLEARFAERLREEFRLNDSPPVDGVERVLDAADGAAVTVTAWWRDDVNGVRYIEVDVRAGRQVRMLRFENAGRARAVAAAAAVGNASVTFPRFADRGDRKWTDFNDLHAAQSLEDVRAQVQDAVDAALVPVSPVDSGKPALRLVDSPPPSAGESSQKGAAPVADAGGNGGKRKPKKEYGQDHWDTVDYLLDNFTLIYGDDAVWDADNRIILKVACMRLAFGTDAVKFWLNNPGRKMVPRDGVVFDPTFSADPSCTVNLYEGIKMVPKKGDCSLIRKLLLHLCDGNAEVAAWVLRWLAFPLQNPGAKMRSSIIVHGDEGSGKNLFFESAVAKIYGEYGGVIGNAQIESQFNEWASKKLYMVADEVVTRTELRQLKGKLKALVTGETVRINPKNMSERDEANHINLVFLSNELQPLALDRSDRRYLVLWTPPKLDEEFYALVGEQVRNGGVEAFYHYLLHDVPLDGFNEHTKPPVNEAKEDLIALGLSPSERFYREWRGGFLPLPYVCCSAEQLYSAFTRWCNIAGERYPPSQTFFGRTITREGRADGVRKHVAQYPLGNAVKQRTVYLVGDQSQEKSQTDWIAAASELFEAELRKFRAGSPVNSES